MLASFAQMDNDVKSERTKNGLRARFLAGLTSGTPPLGYKNENGYAINDAKTWDKVKQAWDLMATGTKTLREMAALMNKQGIRQRFAGKEHDIRPQALSRMFRNKFYIGILSSNKYPDEAKGQHLPMISEALFYRVQAVIDGRNTNINIPLTRRNKDNTDFPLRRILICGTCGNPVTGGWSKGKRTHYAYYRCQKCPKAPSISADKAHQEVVTYLSGITPTSEGLDAFIALLRRTYYQRIAQLQKRREEADKELKRLSEMRQALIQKNLDGIYSDEIFKEQNKLIEDQIAAIKSNIISKEIVLYGILPVVSPRTVG